MAVEFVTLLNMELGVEIPVVRLLQGVSIRQLGTQILELLPAGTATATPRPATPIEAQPPRPAETRSPAAESGVAPAPAPSLPPSPAEPEPRDAEAERWARLDYGRWSPLQQTVRRTMTVGLRGIARLDVRGAANIPGSGAAILAVNHLSMWDVPFMLSVLSRPTIVLAAEELRRYPWMDLFLAQLGNAIYVRRGAGDEEALARALAVLRAGGLLALSPEGSRSADGMLGEGRTGVAYLALRSGAPIVPAVAWGQERMPAAWQRLGRAPVCLRIGKPFRLEPGDASAKTLRTHTSRVMSEIAALLPGEYRGRYAATDADHSGGVRA
jgi:1-acyl-sn-glycerol-3-phosphate acyltransferase